MHEWKPGEKTQITDRVSAYFNQVGTVERLGKSGGLYVRHADNEVEYHPWGFDIVRSGSRATAPKTR